MKLITYSTLCFIAYEILKLFFLPTYYKVSINRSKRLPLILLEFLYLIYLIGLLFTAYWYVGVCVILVSLITAFQLMDDVMDRNKYNGDAGRFLTIDSVVSIFLMSVIIFKEYII